MSGISFKGAVLSKSSNECAPRILKKYNNSNDANGRMIPIETNGWDWDNIDTAMKLVLWGKDYEKFNTFFDAHQNEIPATEEEWYKKVCYFGSQTIRMLRLSKFAKALSELLHIPKAETTQKVDNFIANQNNLNQEVITEKMLKTVLINLKIDGINKSLAKLEGDKKRLIEELQNLDQN